MSKLILFQTYSDYENDIVKNGKLTPSEIDNNFINLKNDDIKDMFFDTDTNDLTITLNNGVSKTVNIPINAIENESNGIIDFNLINDIIVLKTDEDTFTLNLNDSEVIKHLKDKHTIIDGNYNANSGVLTLVKSNGSEIVMDNFTTSFSDGILNDIFLDDTNLVVNMKNGKEFIIDLKPLVSTINVKSISLSNKMLIVDNIKTKNKNGLTINEHLIITDDMTKETKKFTVGDNNPSGEHSLAVGSGNEITAINSLAVGKDNTIEQGNIGGEGNSAAFGKNNNLKAPNSVVVGKDNEVSPLANDSMTQGSKNEMLVGGKTSFISGSENIVNAPGAQAFGRKNKVNGEHSLAQGFNNETGGSGAQAFGKKTKAMGEASHAEGYETTANWKGAHAEGSFTLAQGDSAHAEGIRTRAMEAASHAGGQKTETFALASFVTGSHNKIGEFGKYSFVAGSNNNVDAQISFVYGENNKIDNNCLSNVYILGKNIEAKVNDTLYINKLNINELDKALQLKKFILQQDDEGTVYKLATTDLIEMLNGGVAIINEGEYVSYGDEADENKIILKGDIDDFEVVIDGVNDTHVMAGEYDPYQKVLYLKLNNDETVEIDFGGHDVPLIEVSVKHDDSLEGEGTSMEPLSISKMEKTGFYKPVIDIVDELPADPSVGDRYVSDKTVVTGGYLYKFEDISSIQLDDNWRIPTREDWDTLLNMLEDEQVDKNHNAYGASSWRGKKAGRLLKSTSFGGVDKYGFNILPTSYINNESAVDDDKNAKFWCATQVLGKWDIFSKRFHLDRGTVFNEPIAADESKLSVRLVRDFVEGEVLTPTATINGVEYTVKRFPDNKVWLTCNLMDETIPFTTLDNLNSDSVESGKAIFEWDGDNWVYKILNEGDNVVVLNDDYTTYMLVNGVMVDKHASNNDMQAALDQEIQDRIDGDTQLDTKINTEVQTLNDRIDTEVQTLNDTIDTLEGKVDQEIQDRIDGDQEIHDELDNKVPWSNYGAGKEKCITLDNHQNLLGKTLSGTTVNIGMVSKWDKVDLGTSTLEINLEGLADRPTYNDTKEIALLEDVNAVATDLVTLDGKVDQEIQDRIDGDAQLDSKIDTEVQTLNNRIDAEVQTLNDTIGTLDNKVEQEIQDRIDGDAQLDAKIDAEVQTLNDRVDTEVQTLNDTIDTLDSKVDQEIQDRIDGDTQLDSKIDAEVQTLNDRVDTEVQTLNDTIDVLDGKVDQEIQDRIDGDTHLDSKIDAEVQTLNDTIDVLDGRVDQEIQDRIDGDAQLDSKIDTEVQTLNDRIDEEVQTLNDTIDVLDGRVDIVEGSVTDISDSIEELDGKIEVLDDKIDQEIQDRIKGDVVSGIFDEESGILTLITGGNPIEIQLSADYGTF